MKQNQNMDTLALFSEEEGEQVCLGHQKPLITPLTTFKLAFSCGSFLVLPEFDIIQGNPTFVVREIRQY